MDDLSSNDSENPNSYQMYTLKERNSILEQENLSLKSQIDDALNITAKMEALQEQNAQISQELLNLRTANDNLKVRLQISLQTNTDLLQTIETQKKNLTDQIQNERNAAQIEGGKQKEKYQAHLDQILSELSQAKSENDSLHVAEKVINNKVLRVLESAEMFFHAKILNLDDLCSIFKQPFIEVPQAVTSNGQGQISSVGNSGPISEYEQTIKNLKKRLKNAKKESIKADEKFKDSETLYKREIANLQRKIEFMESQKIELENGHQNSIHELKENILNLQEQLNSARQQNKAQQKLVSSNNHKKNRNYAEQSSYAQPVYEQPVVYQQPEKIIETKRDKNDEIQIENLSSQVAELTTQLKINKEKANDYQTQFKNTERELQDCQSKLNKLQNEYNSIQIVHRESQAEIESLRKALHERQVNFNPKDAKIIINESPDKKLLAKKDATINELQNDLHKKDVENEELNTKIRDLESAIYHKEDELKKFKQEYDDYVYRNESKTKITADDILPPGSFRYSSFSPHLMCEIDKIAMNSSLQPASKIEHCFKVIETHFKAQIQELQRVLHESTNEIGNLRSSIRQLLTDASITLTSSPIPTDTELYNAIDCMKAIVNDFNLNHIRVCREREQFQAIIAQVSNILEADDVVCKADIVKKQLIQLTKRLLSMRRKYKALSNDHEALTNKLKFESEQLNSDLETYKTKCNQYEAKINSQNETIKKLNLTTKSLQNELNYAKEAKKELEESLKEATENELGYMNKKFKEVETQFNSQINTLQDQLNHIQEENSSLQSTINSLENVNRTNNSRINNLLSEKEEMIRENNENIQEITSKFEQERNSLKKTFEQTITELKKHNDKCREDVEQLSKSLSSKDESINELQKTVKMLTISKAKISNEARSLSEQIGREKKLAEATAKSQICAIETKYKEKIENLKNQSTEEQQKMVLYVVDAFRSIFSGFVGRVEDRSFRTLVDRIRDQYGRLQESDVAIRRMLNAQDRQTTQDAVAQLLMNH
ncbi:hypothetical protein TRFO_10300 [Tritrichomonas foetus]|uniref:Uncharacterized protein n=1 Tax=Tritrichomonas foetus TaxID=1144522 RepID=A0A1J4J9Q8_9EUKA|nr:hypothetical protein TRFO_10300 [Tritrichomonas foetus]|eukprot:OHS95888.1 hypothetical protein TRFO_10300 [Tritrichomonas foetus]